MAAAAANNGANETSENEVEPAAETTFPPPSTAIAKEMHKITLVEQRHNTTQLFASLANDTKDLGPAQCPR